MRLTFICPAAHMDDANDLAMALGYGPADGETYRGANWQDADGNLYSVASLPVSDGFIERATSTLDRPEWDVEPYQVNMAGANRAQDRVQVWQPTDDTPEPPQVSPDAILALVGDDPLALLAAAGIKKGTGDEDD